MRLLRFVALLSVLAWPALAQEVPPVEAARTVTIAPPAPPALQAALATLHEDPLFSSSTVSLQVVSVRTGEEVYSWGDDRALVPASVMKLLTSAVALRTLGPNWKFPTWILRDGKVDAAGVLDGSLYVKGQGDPTMVVERMWKMVLDIKLQGIREVKGDVVFDDGYFADSTEIPGWTSTDDQRTAPAYTAPLGALSVNYNLAAMVIRPGAAAGQPAIVELETPSPVIVVENHAVTGGRGSRAWYKVERSVDAETGKIATFKVTGSWPLEREPDTFYRSISDPLGNYMGVFQSLAGQHGIKVKGRFRAGATPAAAERVLESYSDPLSEILATTVKHSNNFMAEQVARSVGAERLGLPGTTEKGMRVVGEYLTSLGVPAGDYSLVNGSGLSRTATFRPSVMNAVLVDMQRNIELAPEFASALSVAGRDGTLRQRFREDGMQGRVRGKTGTLNGVHCLAGYIHAADEDTYAFTFLVNDLDGAVARVRKAHERLVVTVAGIGGNVADGGEGDEVEQ